ncbi:MAG: monovalent cation/H(+) antiporter subunit G [Haloquadratum sp.]|jgi:multicomponent Na+:H+ antiporter subunit G|nr:monovalent cation/H(+) antiporter subunit G [Haloferacaceae archaeon]MDR9445366.1 monovalent cation/H(+) antiporter subunit G [Haloquadratum sp.]
MTPLEVVTAVLLVGGAFFGFVAVVGVLRLPDLYSRAHATSKSDTLGVLLTLIAVSIVFDAQLATVKALLLAVFLFVTNPTAAHAIARSAYDQGIAPIIGGRR